MNDRYPDNWNEIALKLKEKANWKCQKCGMECLKPNDNTKGLSKSERSKRTLTVHHRNYKPEDNSPGNLVALCSSYHLYYHRGGKGNETGAKRCGTHFGQLSLFNVEDYK